MAGPIGLRGMISVLCTLGYEPSMLYIRKQLNRTGAMRDPASELRRIPLLRTRVNSALEELEDGLVDRGVPFDS
jgi:hypothetical protein